MKSTEQILECLAEHIGHIYFRPLMYGGTAEGVDLLLSNYQHLWALIVEREREFKDLSIKTHIDQGCGAMSFSIAYKRNHPDAPEHETIFHVVDQWRKISDGIKIPIPFEKIKQELRPLLMHGNPNKILNEKYFI